MKTRSTLVLIPAMLLLVLGGWLYWQREQAQLDNASLPTAETEPVPDRVKLLLDWAPNTNHTGLYVAKAKGWFAAQGVEVEIIEPGDGVSVEQVVAAGQADFGISYQEAVTLARAEDVPIVSIAAVIQHNTSAFASLKSSGIQTVSDFVGKKYGGWGSPIELATLQAVMTDAGADYNQLTITTLGQTDFVNSIGRENDFQWIYYGWAGIHAAESKIDLNLIWLKDLDPALDYYTPVLITSENLIRERPDLVKRFLHAASQGYLFAIQQPEGAATILLEQVPELDANLVRASQAWISNEYQANARQWGEQSEAVWANYTTWLVEHDQLKAPIDHAAAFTNDFLPDDK